MADAEARLRAQVGAYLEGSLAATELVGVLAGTQAVDAGFWTGVALLDAGQDERAASELRTWLHANDASPLRATAETLIVVAEGGLADAVRIAFDEDPQHWRRRCPVALDGLVDVLAEEDPDLLCRVLDALADDGLLATAAGEHAAHAMVRLATQAEHVGLAHARLRVAERLMRAV